MMELLRKKYLTESYATGHDDYIVNTRIKLKKFYILNTWTFTH